jgi:hypothetical protein
VVFLTVSLDIIMSIQVAHVFWNRW